MLRNGRVSDFKARVDNSDTSHRAALSDESEEEEEEGSNEAVRIAFLCTLVEESVQGVWIGTNVLDVRVTTKGSGSTD
jgi:hypothetical protein